MNGDWVKIYASIFPHKVALLQAFLKENHIHSVILNRQDSMNTSLNIDVEVELFVSPDQVLTARHLIQKHPL